MAIERGSCRVTLAAANGAITLDALKRLLANSGGEATDNFAQTEYRFEREVAAIYRALGAHVEQDLAFAGNQIDLFIEGATSSGARLRTAIECKAYVRPAGIDVVNQFASLNALLKQRGIIDRGAIVTRQEFTNRARAAGEEMDLELLDLADLQQRVQGRTEALQAAEIEIDIARRKSAESQKPPRIFVLMPVSLAMSICLEFVRSRRSLASPWSERMTSSTTKAFSM